MKSRFALLFVLGLALFVSFILAQTVILQDIFTSTDSVTNVTKEPANFSHLSFSDSNIVFYMPFDVNTTTNPINRVIDYSAASLDGNLTGGAFYNASGIFGGAVVMDGVNDYIVMPSNTFTGITNNTNFTLAAWAKITNVASTASALVGSISAGGAGFYSYAIRLEPGPTMRCLVGNGTGFIHTTFITPSTSWAHYACTWNGTTLSIYMNGVLQEALPNAGSITGNIPGLRTDNVLVIGASNAGGAGYLNGSVDEIIAFNRTLNSSDVLSLYRNQTQRFYATGEHIFTSINVSTLGTENYVNISLNKTAISSALNFTIQIGNLSGGSYSYGSTYSPDANGFFKNVPIGTPNNLSVKVIFQSAARFMSPQLQGLTLTSLFNSDPNPPQVTINFPRNTTYTQNDLPFIFNVTLNKIGTVSYSLNSGATNSSMSSPDNLNFNATLNAENSSSYTLNVYATDDFNNYNFTTSVSFSLDVGSAINFTSATLPSYANITSNTTSRFSLPIYVDVNLTNRAYTRFYLYTIGGGLVNLSTYSGAVNFINFTNISYGNYYYNVFINDTSGNTFTTGSRVVNFNRPLYFNLNVSSIWYNNLISDQSASLAAIGDSITTNTNTYVWFLRNRLHEAFGNGGLGYREMGFGISSTEITGVSPLQGFARTEGGTYAFTDMTSGTGSPPVPTNDTFAVDGQYGLLGHNGTYTLTLYGKNATLYYVKQANGGIINLSYSNGTNIAFLDSNLTSGAKSVQTYSFPFPTTNDTTSVSLKISLTNSSLSNPTWTQINGIQVIGHTNGAIFHRLGKGGADPSYYNEFNETAFNTSLSTINPDLILFMFDSSIAWTDSNFRGNITQLLDRIENATNANIIMVSHHNNTATGGDSTLRNQTNIYADIAMQRGLGFINFYDLYSADQLSSLSYLADTIHMSAAGGEYFGNYTYQLLINANNVTIDDSDDGSDDNETSSDTDDESEDPSSSGSSGLAYWQLTFPADSKDFSVSDPIIRDLSPRQRVRISFDGESHSIGITKVNSDSAIVNVSSLSQQALLKIGQSARFELNGDSYYDLIVSLLGIESGRARIEAMYIHEEIPTDKEPSTPSIVDYVPEQIRNLTPYYYLAAAFVVLLIVLIFYRVHLKHKPRR